jgi:uncharacterized damage-inducible protein DinB
MEEKIMFLNIDDFAHEWDQEYLLTLTVLKALTDESLGQAITNERRNLGELGLHLVKSINFMTHLGLTFEEVTDNELVPLSSAVIVESYRRVGQSFLNAIKAQWNDEDLQTSQKVMSEEWKNGASLHFAIMHQAHHRGQMTVLIRQAGLRIPEIYGPTYETWLERGLDPLE